MPKKQKASHTGPGNRNHPVKGSRIKVEPIRDRENINRIKANLQHKPRNYALFVMGINTNLRAGDLAGIRLRQVVNVKSGEFIEIREGKTGKSRKITLNKDVCRAIRKLHRSGRIRTDDYLFKSQRGNGPLTVSSISRLVKRWCREVSLTGNYGSHTLRKTWGYHAWKAGIDLPRLMICFNHSTQEQTLSYLCIQEKHIREVYLKVQL